jgi:hypothetical protein
MPVEIVRQLTPEEEELHRKREELASIRATLAERELELADLRAQLKSFEGRYLRQVGVLYAQLDDWDAKVAELEARLEKSTAAHQRAQRARQRADETHEATHGEASKAPDFKPSADLKSLFRKAAKQFHPDFSKDSADQRRRAEQFIQAKAAFDRGDSESLQRLIDEDQNSGDSILGEGVGAELIRLIRQIAQAKRHIAAIEQELTTTRTSELAKLQQDVDQAQQKGRDILAELAATVTEQIARARKEYEALAEEAKERGR